jgi:hypothetical protein
MRRCLFVLGLVAASFAFSCKDEHDHSEGHATFPVCEEIIAACHELDTGSGLAHDCHDVAHDAKDEATCTAKKAECLAGCVKTDAGATDSGSSDAPTGG